MPDGQPVMPERPLLPLIRSAARATLTDVHTEANAVTDAHHTRPETVPVSRFEYAAHNLPEVVGGVLRIVDQFLTEHPKAAARIGSAAGNLIGSFRAAVQSHQYPSEPA